MRSRECCSHTFNPLQLSCCTLTEVSKAHSESTHKEHSLADDNIAMHVIEKIALGLKVYL